MFDELWGIVKTALGALATALVSVGFVAFVGAAILWARYYAAELPQDQAVAVVPRSELVAVGASALVVFVAAGLLAVLAVFVISPQGRPTRSTALALLVVLAAELTVTLLTAEFAEGALRWLLVGYAVGLVALGVAAIVLLPKGIAEGEAASRERAKTIGAVACGVVIIALFSFAVLEWWLAALTVIVVVLAFVSLAIAEVSGPRFLPFALAVFVSIAVFGASFSFIRAAETPRVQAAAFLTKGDERRGACALYITETDARLFLARVDLLPGSKDSKPREASGRLFSLPKDRLLAWAIGPLQPIGKAQTQAVALRDEMLAQQPGSVPEATVTPSATASATATPAPNGGTSASLVSQGTDGTGTRLADGAVAAKPAGARVADLCSPRGAREQERQSAERTLARKYMPILSVHKDDGFWPISVGTLFDMRGGTGGNSLTCVDAPGAGCYRITPSEPLPWAGAPNQWLEYPAGERSTGDQERDVLRALRRDDPYATSLQYFLVARGGGPNALTSLQYWYFFPFNYQKIVGVPGVAAGFHEGDFESTGILLSRTGRPVYVWLARHGAEGERYAFDEPALTKSGDHVRVFSALGSHATYATCGRQRRPHLKGRIDDNVPCPEDNPLVFEPQSTRLSDLSLAPWACFQGRFGHSIADQSLLTRLKGAIVADGPRSPLWQQTFGGTEARPCDGTDEPEVRDLKREESNDDVTSQRLRDGAGSLKPLFSTCEYWKQRPTQGAYVSVCDTGILDRYFRSGLENAGRQRITVRTASGDPVTTVPAVLRTRNPDNVDGAVISAAHTGTPDVWVARYAGASSDRMLTGFFSGVEVGPDRDLTLDVSDSSRWRLLDEDGSAVAQATPEPYTPPANPGGTQDINSGVDTLSGRPAS